MISLCNNIQTVSSALQSIGGNKAVNELIRIYLDSYGVSYDFNQFYIQYSNDVPTSLIHRYNNQVCLITSLESDKEELLLYLKGFKECQIIADGLDKSDYSCSDECYVMTKYGKSCDVLIPEISDCTDAKIISELVCKNDSSEKKMDFFLNTAHQLRHNVINIKCYCLMKTPVCAVASTNINADVSVLTFVYTDEYFRGNGYMRKLLLHVCDNPFKKYLLLCEKHNVDFYKKSGFKQEDTLLKFNM